MEQQKTGRAPLNGRKLIIVGLCDVLRVVTPGVRGKNEFMAEMDNRGLGLLL